MGCVKINALLQAKLVKLLLQGGCSAQELADDTGLHVTTVREYLQALRKEKHVLYVCGRDTDEMGRQCVRLWKLGDKPDVPQPAPKSHKQMKAESRSRRKQAELLGLITDVRL